MKKLLAMLFAAVMVMSLLAVAVFAEPGDVDELPGEPSDIVVDEPTVQPDDNPVTGVAVAVLPMVIAGAAVAFGKKH